MKIILSFVLAGLFVSCSGDDNPANSPAKTIGVTFDS